MKCPQCDRPLRIAGTKQYIELDPEDNTKGYLKMERTRICVNPLCPNYAGSGTKTVSFEYEKNGKKVIEQDNRPNISYSNPSKVVCIDTVEEVLEVRGGDLTVAP